MTNFVSKASTGSTILRTEWSSSSIYVSQGYAKIVGSATVPETQQISTRYHQFVQGKEFFVVLSFVRSIQFAHDSMFHDHPDKKSSPLSD